MPMNNVAIWQERLKAHHKKVFRYAKYMLNDHFMLVLFFLLGFFLLEYSQWLKTVTALTSLQQLLLSIVGASLVFFGDLATLTQGADRQFLSVSGQAFRPYLKKALKYSLLVPAGLLFGVASLLAPLLTQITHQGLMMSMGIFGLLLLFKLMHLSLQYWYFEGSLMPHWWHPVGLFLGTAGSLWLVLHRLSLSDIWGLFLLLLGGWLGLWLFMTRVPRVYQWEWFIQKEEKRQNRLFKLLALFVDVPFIQGQHAKRRRWLDWLVLGLSPKQAHPYQYLMVRTLIRYSSFTSFFGVTMLVSAFTASITQQWYWLLAINSLLLGVLCVQFLALNRQLQQTCSQLSLLFSSEEIVHDTLRVIGRIMSVTSMIMVILSFSLTKTIGTLSGLVLYPLVTSMWMYFYLKPRLQRQLNKSAIPISSNK